MPVPRNRTSNARKGNRRSHHAKKPKNTFACPNCSKPKISHVTCQSCGHYAERQVIHVETN